MAKRSRIVAAAVVGAALLGAAHPVAQMLRATPSETLVAEPAPTIASAARNVDGRFSRDELERRELSAQAIADGASQRSASLTKQAAGIDRVEKALQKKAAERRAEQRKAEQRKAAERKAAERKAAQRKAEQRAAEQRKQAAKQKASKSSSSAKSAPAPTGSPQSIAKKMMQSDYGWGASEFTCYDNIIKRESDWDYRASNPSSGAYGIPQALPGSKMASAGSDWRTNPATQIEWSLGYIKDRYHTPCQAWGFKSSHGWC